MDIKQFNFKKEIQEFLEHKNFADFTSAQKHVIPILLKEKSVMVEAPTGTGKTLSFLLPIINNIDPQAEAVQAIVFVPTRELAKQIWLVAKEIQKYIDFSLLLAVGGEEKDRQLRKLNNKPQIIITTPERLGLLCEQSPTSFGSLKYIVIDEADMIIEFGSWGDINSFYSQYLNKEISTSLFSATLTESLMNFMSKKIAGTIKKVQIKKDEDIQVVKLVSLMDYRKEDRLLHIIKSDKFNPFLALIFVKSNDEARRVYSFLKSQGIKNIMEFNSDMTQRERNRVMKAVANNEVEMLITTDIMARGMDFEGITHIVNYTLPVDINYYRHRIGRTNRGKVKGDVYDLYSLSDQETYDKLKKKNPWIVFEKTKVN